MDSSTGSTEILILKGPRGQNECQSQVRNLIQQLSSWKDESHRQMSNILSSHSRSIKHGFNGLAEEFNDLLAQVSVLREERNVLLETVDNLNNEIRQMSAKLNLAERQIQGKDNCEVDIPVIKEECVESHRIQVETNVEENCMDYSEDMHNTRKPSEDQIALNATTVRELDEEGNSDHFQTNTSAGQDQDVGLDLEQRVSKETKIKLTLHPKKVICEVCKFVFSTSENLDIHLKNVHSKLEKSKPSKEDEESPVILSSNADEALEDAKMSHTRVSLDKIGNNAKIHACDECGYASSRTNSLKRHWDAVHNMGDKKFKCDICLYSSATVYDFKNHLISAHNIGEKKFKCDKCPYSSVTKDNLNMHRGIPHGKGANKFQCEECGYAASHKDNLKTHRITVHNIEGKLFKCRDCPFSSTKKQNLNQHRDGVHNEGGKRFKCDKCPFSSNRKENLKKHIAAVHENIRSHVCEECGYAGAQKAHLKRHHIRVHKTGAL